MLRINDLDVGGHQGRLATSRNQTKYRQARVAADMTENPVALAAVYAAPVKSVLRVPKTRPS